MMKTQAEEISTLNQSWESKLQEAISKSEHASTQQPGALNATPTIHHVSFRKPIYQKTSRLDPTHYVPSNQRLLQMKNLNPATLLPQFTNNPTETSLNSNELNGAATQVVNKQPQANNVYQQAQNSHAISPNDHLDEIQSGTRVIDGADNTPSHLGCAENQCDHTESRASTDLNEGLVRLGALGANADEVSTKQIGSGNPAIFAGYNYQCRIAVALHRRNYHALIFSA